MSSTAAHCAATNSDASTARLVTFDYGLGAANKASFLRASGAFVGDTGTTVEAAALRIPAAHDERPSGARA